MPKDPLPTLRKLCLALPETTERLSHGSPCWFVRDRRVFVMFDNHHTPGRVAFHCAASDGMQELLLLGAPERFFVPPYVGHRGWLGIWLDGVVNWKRIADLVTEAYRQVAPKSLVAQLEGRLKGLNP